MALSNSLKRPDGRFTATATINGKKKFFYAKTKSAAIKKRDEFIESTKNTVNFDDTITLEDWYKQWRNAKKPTVTAATYESYTSHIERYIIPVLGSYRLVDFTIPGLRNFILKESEKELSPRTVRYTHLLLKSLFAMAVDDEILAKNPMSKIVPPQKKKVRTIVTLTKDQVNQFLHTIENFKHKVLFKTDFASGLRRSELLGLTWSDIDFFKSTLTVNQTVLRIGNDIVLSPTTKTATSKRTITVDNDTMDALRRLKIAVDKERLKNFRWINNNLVFPGKNGKPMRPDYVSKLAKKYGRAIGIEEFTMHAVRHTHATLLLESGVNIKVVQERLGHSTIKETMDTYSHVTKNMDNMTIKVIEEIFSTTA